MHGLQEQQLLLFQRQLHGFRIQRIVVRFLGIVRFIRRILLLFRRLLLRFAFFRLLLVRLEFFQLLVVPERKLGLAMVDDDVGMVLRSGVLLLVELFQQRKFLFRRRGGNVIGVL